MMFMNTKSFGVIKLLYCVCVCACADFRYIYWYIVDINFVELVR